MSTSASDLVVDIVINNHNYGAYLEDAIESARGQTHARVNVLVVDDGSTDDSREILARYGDRIGLILRENGGQASALNAGAEACEGDVVMFLDADDVLRPEAAARVAAAFAADPGVSKAQFRMETIDAAGRPTGELKPAAHLPMPNGDLRAAELASPYDLVWMATSANAFRTEALRRILPIPESEYPVTGADWYLVHLTALLGRVVSLDAVGAGYRVHGANSYELAQSGIDLAHLRQAIGFAASTSRELLRLADELGVERPQRILSVADLANRMTSLRLDPAHHPIPADRRLGLLADSVRAVRRRQGISAAMKVAFVAWFAAMAAAPRGLATKLAELFLFPERRRSLNGLLGRLQRSGGTGTAAVA
ncbi:MAG TPA: glycosyltransferase [Solirubrobacterales bacterium]|nr:glycosyltransferase [Solirubrobacterales bacterium]